MPDPEVVKNDEPQADVPKDFASWLAKQPDEVRGQLGPLHEADLTGLKTALDAERVTRRDLEKKFREAAAQVEPGGAAAMALTAAADAAAAAEKKADFYLAAQGAGVSNLKLAFTVAIQDELFDRKGGPDFEAMRKTYPELFTAKLSVVPGHAGAGTGSPQAGTGSMNEIIRRAAGR